MIVMVRPANPYAVYRAYDAEGRLLYVGATKNLPNRLGTHRHAAWFATMTLMLVERYATAREASDREQEWITNGHPLYNKVRGVYWDGAPDYIPFQRIDLPAYVVEVSA